MDIGAYMEKRTRKMIRLFLKGYYDRKSWLCKKRKLVNSVSEAKAFMVYFEERMCNENIKCDNGYSLSNVELRRQHNITALLRERLIADYPEFRGETLGKNLNII